MSHVPVLEIIINKTREYFFISSVLLSYFCNILIIYQKFHKYVYLSYQQFCQLLTPTISLIKSFIRLIVGVSNSRQITLIVGDLH